MKISVIIPMYNEEENVKETIPRVVKVLERYEDWELLVVDDGSTDRTLELANRLASEEPRLRVLSYQPNIGRGKALREGFTHATGDIIVTLDADLSYDESYIPNLISELEKDSNVDIVIGSPYTKEGKVQGFSPFHYRLLLSRYGNRILSLALSRRLTCATGILRAYRRSVLDDLELESTGKEIHLEILSKAFAIGSRVNEIPATLRVRKKGKSKFRVRATTVSHLLFSFFEKPALLFGLAGVGMLTLGLISGVYITILWLKGVLNPTRPLMILMVLLILVGMQVLFFAFIASQVATLRKEIYKVQKENLELEKEIRSTKNKKA